MAADNISKFYNAFSAEYDNFASEQEFRDWLGKADASKMNNLYKAFNSVYDNFSKPEDMNAYLGWGEAPNAEAKPVETISRAGGGMSVLNDSPIQPLGFSTKFQPNATPSRGDVVPAATTAPEQGVAPEAAPQFEMPNPDIMWGGDTLKDFEQFQPDLSGLSEDEKFIREYENRKRNFSMETPGALGWLNENQPAYVAARARIANPLRGEGDASIRQEMADTAGERAFVEEYARRKKEFDRKKDEAFRSAGKHTSEQIVDPAEREWLEENKFRFEQAKKHQADLQDALEHSPEWQALGAENEEHLKQASANAYAAAVSTANFGDPDYNASVMLDTASPEEVYAAQDKRHWMDAVRLDKLTAREMKKGNKLDAKVGGVSENIKQYVEGFTNNIDVANILTFGLAEAGPLTDARAIGEKSNKIITEAIKASGYEGDVASLETDIRSIREQIAPLDAKLKTLSRGLEDMVATYNDMAKSGASEAELREYYKQYEKKYAEYKAKYDEYAPLAEKYNEALGTYKTVSDAIDNALEVGLSESEKAVLEAYDRYAYVTGVRAANISNAANAGAAAEQSAEFMLDFILTGGLGKAGTKAATKLTAKWAAKRAGRSGMQNIAADLPEAMNKLVAKGIKPSIGATMLTDMGVAAKRTLLMFPRSLDAYGQALIELNPEQQKDEFGRYNFSRSYVNAALNTALNQYIEYWSEGFGTYFAAGEQALFKAVTGSAPATAIGRILSQYRGSIGKYLDYGKFDGMFNEMLEEVVGSIFDTLAGAFTGNRLGDADAASNFFAADNLTTLFFSFLPMSAISAGTNISAYNKMKKRYNDSAEALSPFLDGGVISQADLDALTADITGSTPEHIKDRIVAITDKAREANGGRLPDNFTQSLLGLVEGSLCMQMEGERWADSAEKAQVASSYATTYANPVYNPWDVDKVEQDARQAAVAAGFTEEELDQDPLRMAQNALAMQDRDPERAGVLTAYANAKASKQGLEDGYREETMALTDEEDKYIRETLDTNGQVISATLNGEQVFVTAKDVTVTPDGRITVKGKDGVVTIQRGDKSQGTVKASQLENASAVNTDVFAIITVNGLANAREAAYQRAASTISVNGMRQAVTDMVGQTVYISDGQGVYEPIQIVRSTGNGKVVVKGSKNALDAIIVAAQVNIPRGSQVEVDAARIYPMLAQNEDGSLTTDAPTQAAPTQAPIAQQAQAPSVPTEEAPAAQEAPVEASPVEGPSMSDLQGSERTIYINGNAYNVEVTRANERTGQIEVMYKDEEGNDIPAPAGMPNVFDYSFFVQALSEPVASAPAEAEAPAPEAPVAEVPAAPASTTFDGKSTNQWVRENTPLLFDEEMSDADRAAFVGALKAELEALRAKKAELEDKRENDKPQVTTDLQKNIEARKALRAKYTAQIEALDAEIAERERRLEGIRGVLGEINSRYAPFVPVAAKEQFSEEELAPQTPEEAVAEYIAKNFKSGGQTIDIDDFRRETGYKGEASDFFFLKKGGMTIRQLAERIAAEYPGLFGGAANEADAYASGNEADDSRARNAIIDLFGQVRNKTDINNYVLGHRREQAQAEAERQNADLRHAMEEAVGMPLEQYESQRQRMIQEDINAVLGSLPEGSDVAAAMRNYYTEKFGEAQPEAPAEEAPAEAPVAEASVEGPAADVEDLPFSKSETVSIEENPNTEAKKARIAEWADRLGLPITIYESLDDVKDPTARREIVFADMARARGGKAIVEAWYNPTTHKVEIYLPHLAEGRIDAVILHEVVAHRGLRELLKTVGEDGKVSYEKFDALMDYIWNDLMSARDRARWLAYNSHIQGNAEALRRAAADEYVAHFSETLDPDAHPSKWRRFVAKVKQFLKSIGIDIKLSGKDMDALLRNSLLNYEQNRASAEEEGTIDGDIRFSRVYHGTGADFDRFDHSHMGEGSGSQSYGWGTYVTTNHDTGTTYANSTSGKRVNYAGEKAPTSYADELVNGIAQDMQDHDKSFEDAKRENLDMLKRVEEKRKAGELGEYWKNVSNEKEIEFLEGLKESDFNVRGDGGRHLYLVDIPDDNGENYLHWDGYLTRGQSNKIMDAVREILKQRGEYQPETENEIKSALGFGTIGRQVESGLDYFLGDEKNYSTGENPGAERNAKILNSIGIVGMEIPIDRNGGQRYPGSNYVIFDENNLKIADHLRFSRTPEQKAEDEKIFAAAKDYFGTTRNIREAGYILPDGTMLDFSGRHLLDEGSDSSFLAGRRTTDHREIESLNYEKDGNTPSGLNVSMPDFIRSGAIRIDSNAGAINLATLPTDAQQAVLRRLIEANGGDVWVDFGDGYNSEHYAEYEGARPARVLNEITRFFNEGYRPENIQFSKQDFESAQADQKQPNGNYPSSAELESDAIRFSLTRNNRATIASWLNKRADLNEEQKASVMAYLEELENPTLQLATAKWFTQGSVRLPEDMSKVEQAVAVARKAKVDPLQYASPMELIDRHGDITLSEKPIDPDTVSTLHRAKDIPEHGLVVYDVDDTQESRENMRKIINTHFGKEASPWCLLQGDGDGHLTESSATYWKHYDGYPKQVVFRNGKLLAFSANDSEERLWWDRQDGPHRNMPAGRLPLKGDELGRSADYIYAEDGKLRLEQGTRYYKGNKQNGDYAEWLQDGTLSETGHYTNGKEDGEFVSYWDNGKVQSVRHYKNGLADGLHEYYYTDGSIRSRSYFKDDKFDGVQSSYYENGNPYIERSIRNGKLDGPSTKYYKNGLMEEYVEFKGEKKEGVHRRWASNGVLMVEEHFKNDNLEGESRRWFGVGGAINRIENYKNNRLDGIQELYEWEWGDKSYLAQRNVYENGKKTFSEEFWSDGSLRSVKSWDNEGRPNGVWKRWGPSGNLISMEAYNHSFLGERNLLVEGVTEEQADNLRFSKANANEEIFISNAEKAVEDIKQEKATPQQWLAQLEKNGGLKAGEDKWLGLSDWLKASDRKTLTKQEVLDYIKANKIIIEETDYSEAADKDEARALQSYQEELDELAEQGEEETGSIYVGDHYLWAWNKMLERYGDDFYSAFVYEINPDGKYVLVPQTDWDDNLSGPAQYFIDQRMSSPVRRINPTRRIYTTRGLTNNREIALTVPTIEPWNESDSIHFGDAGEGRAIAWTRFGDTTTTADGEYASRSIMDELEKKYGDPRDYDSMTDEDVAKVYFADYIYRGTGHFLHDYLGGYETAFMKTDLGAERAARVYPIFEEMVMDNAAKGQRVLAIDEIQSKRHQEGREQGYQSDTPDTADPLREELAKKERRYAEIEATIEQDYNNDHAEAYRLRELQKDVRAAAEYEQLEQQIQAIYDRIHSRGGEYNRLRAEIRELQDRIEVEQRIYDYRREGRIPDAPFEKNWHELAMKRMLRLAAEEGYNYLAWTTGEQQAARYNIGQVVDKIISHPYEKQSESEVDGFDVDIYGKDGRAPIATLFVTKEGEISSDEDAYNGKQLSEIIGKELSKKILESNDMLSLSGEDLRIGAEGMKGFYDDILPRFMNKYGKKWGVKVEDIELPGLEESARIMHAVPITPEMRESVMEGQLMFSKVEDNEKMYSDFKKKYTPLAPMVSMKVYNNADELGNYTDGNIAIFVNKNESPEETENTCFHENVHAYTDVAGISQEDYAKVVAFFMEGFKGETLEYWTETRKWVEGKKNYEGIVEEEMAARLLGDLMSSSHAARILRVVSRLAPEVHAIISDYFNRLGYDAEQESAERAAAERAISVSGRDSGDVLEGGEEGARGTETRYSKVTDVPDGLAGDIVLSRAIDELADSFKGAVKVNQVTRDQMPKGHKTDKGYYNTRTGEVYICIDNIESVDDAIATVMHEAVAHLGLRQLFGDRFPEAMTAIYEAMSPEIRHEVHASMTRNGWDAITATEEYLARLAEKEEFTPQEKTFWDRVKEIFEAILSAITGKANVSLTDNELRYILQASYMNLTATPAERQGVQYAAREILLKDKYKVNDYVEPEYLARTPVFANGTDSIKNYEESVERKWQVAQMELQDAQQPVRIGIAATQAETGNKPITEDEDYLTKENLASSIAQTQQVESLMFQIAPIVEQVGHIIEKISGKKNPSREERAKIYNDIISYLYAKHGAERNRYANAKFAEELPEELEKIRKEYEDAVAAAEKQMEAQNIALRAGQTERKYTSEQVASLLKANKENLKEQKAKLKREYNSKKEKLEKKYAAKDWSGLTSLFGLEKTEHEAAEKLADELCEKFEKEVGKDDIDLLWDRIQAATDYNLKHALDSGLLSKDEYDRLHGNKEKGIARMWEHYVPLRGFTEKTAEEEYNYANLTRQQANTVVTKKYKGRTSLASDPIANIVNIGETEIRQGNANLAKIALYRYVMNRPEGKLLTATDMWFVKQDDGTWVLAEPQAKYDASDKQVGTESFEDFENRMEALKAKGLARKGRRNLQLDKIMTNPGHQNEHLIRLKVNGQEKGIWVNGNPQLARAVAGALRTEESWQWIRNLTRSLSNLFTTYSLKFALRNFWRDTLYSQMRLLAMTEENGREYWVKYEGNWFKNFGIMNAPMIRMVSEWNKGTLQKKKNPTETEKLFLDFMRDGGPTGYTVVRSVEQVIKDLHKELNMFRPDGSWLKVMWENASSSQFAKVLGIYPRAVQALNESFELLTRFTAYQTSRQMGKSGQQAAADAKEISVNFNRKGAQSGKEVFGIVAAYFGSTHYFFNAGVQGFQNFMGLYQKHPYKMTAFSTMLAFMGFLSPFLNAMLGAFGGGDDDDDQTSWYWNLPEWTRRSNIILGTSKFYIAIALGPEQRALYALGDILAGYVDGCYANKSVMNIAADMVSSLAGLLPINPVEDLKGSKNVLDAALRTVFPDPLMAGYDMAVNRDYTGRPLQKENPFDKSSPNCYGAYSSTPEGIVKACQWIAEETAKVGYMIDLPPGYIREVFRQYGGGVYTAFEEAAKFTTGILNEDKPLRLSDFPLTSGMIGRVDDDRKDSFAKNALNEYKSFEQMMVKTMRVLLHDPNITAKTLFEEGLPDDAPKYASKLFEGEDFELAKKYYVGENGKYLIAANGKRIRKQEAGLKDYREKWNNLKEEYAMMPKGTEEEKKAREKKKEEIEKAWNELVTAENKLVDELLNFEYDHPSVSKKIEDAIKK